MVAEFFVIAGWGYAVVVGINFADGVAVRQTGSDNAVVFFADITIFVKNHAPRIVVCDEIEKPVGCRARP